MDKEIRNHIQRATQAARALLEHEYAEQLEGTFDIRLDGMIAAEPGEHLDALQRVLRTKLVAAVEHLGAGGLKKAEAIAGYLREAAFTTLNRFVALKMLEARGLVQECISRGEQSAGFKEFTGLAPGLVQLPDHGYRLYIESLFDEIGCEVRVLFDRRDPASLLWPRRQALVDLLDILNIHELSEAWQEDETIGWVYQYFNSDEDRKKARYDSKSKPKAPQNSYELAVRNQFFTPRYVVEFLTDNTLGRIWYEMRQGRTRLVDECDYLIKRPAEIFLAEGEQAPEGDSNSDENLSQEELLKKPVYIPFREKKDPRDLKILDPACGSGHFLLYAFDLLISIYEEAWEDDFRPNSEVTGHNLRDDYPILDDLRRALPGLVLRHNLYGIDIDPRAVQIAALALWMRAQRAYNDFGIARSDRLPISKTNIVIAEPMPGEKEFRREFVASLDKRLGQLVERVFEKMGLAGEFGSLLKIEDEIQVTIRDIYGETGKLFRKSDEERWHEAEAELERSLHTYAERTLNGQAYQRHLFADDAARGLGFIEICRNRFEVILMNPPFGEGVPRTTDLLGQVFPSWNRNLACAFFLSGISRGTQRGVIGAILDRTFANKSTYESFRKGLLLKHGIAHFVDLGWDVLDANVEVCCLVANVTNEQILARFQDCRSQQLDDKAFILRQAAKADLGDLDKTDSLFWHRPMSIFSLPNAAFIYDLPDSLLEAFRRFPNLKSQGFEGFTGFQLQSERHFRNHWERDEDGPLGSSEIFAPMYNGGEYRRFSFPLRQIARIGGYLSITSENFPSYSYRLQNKAVQFFEGIGFGVRGNFLDAHILPAGTIFTVEGQSIPCSDETKRFSLLGFLNSVAFQRLINVICGQHKYSGYVNIVPFPPQCVNEDIAKGAKEIYTTKRRWQRQKETDYEYVGPKAAFAALGDYQAVVREIDADDSRIMNLESFINAIVCRHLGLSQEAIEELDCYASSIPRGRIFDEDDFTERSLAFDRVQFLIGLVFGRWTKSFRVSFLSGRADSEHAFCEGDNTIFLAPSTQANSHVEEPAIRGILSDDPGTDFDIVETIRRVWTSLQWPNCDLWDHHRRIFKVDLRQWIQSEFFDLHISAYTVGRRKAPIYLQLATPSASYSVWLYYHRFTKDTFYKVLNDYVTPKLQHEERKLTNLVQTSGPGATASQRKEIAEQEAFVEELRVFQKEIARIAPLWNPDLNDGVIINFAPLWRLVPQHRAWQKECKAYWDKLVAGDYDWAHLAMHLWPERVVPKCAEDRSLAIAHGLEEVFWAEDDNGKWQPRRVDPATIDQFIKERTSAAVKDALKSLLEAPTPMTKRRTSRAKSTRQKSSSRNSRSTATNDPAPRGARDGMAGEAHA